MPFTEEEKFGGGDVNQEHCLGGSKFVMLTRIILEEVRWAVGLTYIFIFRDVGHI